MTAKRGSARHAVRMACPADDLWALVGAPERVPEWFPGIESCTVDRRPAGGSHPVGPAHARAAPHRRPHPAAPAVPDHRPDVHRAPQHHRRPRPGRRDAAWWSTASTPTRPPWPWSSAGRPGPGSKACPRCWASGRVPSVTGRPTVHDRRGAPLMGRKILLVTTDQQRYDTLGLQRRHPGPDPGGRPAGRRRDPLRAGPPPVGGVHAVPLDHPDRPAPGTHGVWMNGVPLPVDAPSVAEVLHRAGYRTALVGKAHFEPFLDPFLRFAENALARTGTEPPGRTSTAASSIWSWPPTAPSGPLHYARWLVGRAPRGSGRLLPGPRRLACRSTRPAAATPAPPR